MNKIKSWLLKKLVDPIKGQLTQGYSVRTVTLSIATGIALGSCPIIGLSTSLGLIIGALFRLNHIVLQTVNYAMTPIHLTLIIPFLIWGQKLFADTVVPLNLLRMFKEFNADSLLFFKTYGIIALQAFFLWLLLTPILVVAAYFICLPLVSGLAKITAKATQKH